MSIYHCRIYDLPWIIYHLAPPILAQPCGRSNPLSFVMPLAEEIPYKKTTFRLGQCVFKADICGMGNNYPHRAHPWIYIHNSSLGVPHVIVRETNSTKTNTHVAHGVDCGPRPLQCDGHTMEAPTQHVHGWHVCMLRTPSTRMFMVVGWNERVCPKWCAAHPRLIGTCKSVRPANTTSPFGAVGLCNINYGCACHCSISCGGCRGEKMTTTIEGIPPGPSNYLDLKYSLIFYSNFFLYSDYSNYNN